MNKKSIIILHKHNGEYQGWMEIQEKDLEKWMSDGSIEEGDTIIYPKKSLSVVLEKKLRLNDALEKKDALSGNAEVGK